MAQQNQGFGAALQTAYPLLLAMSNGLSSGQGVFSQAGPGLAAMMQLQDRRKQTAEEAAEKARLAQEQQMVGGLFGKMMGGQGGGQPGQGYSPPAPNPAAGLSLGQTGPVNNTVDPETGLDLGRAVRPTIPEPIKAGIFAGESGGDYDALFGYSNRPGGRYSDVRLTNMTVDQAIDFTNPSGDYGQWVKGQVGRVATPVGAYQIVGKTLRGAKDALGLTGNERMTPELQDQLGAHIYQTQGTGAWEGYRGPQTNSGVISAQGNLPQGARPTQRAPQFDPNRLAQLVMSDTVPSVVKQLALNRAFPSNRPVEWQRFEGPDGSVNALNPETLEYVEIMPAGQGGGDQPEYGLTPQYVTRADGSLGMVQLSKDGTAKEVDLPEGLALQKGIEKLDLGTAFQWYNTLTAQPIGEPIPKNNEQAAADTARGGVLGRAEAESEISAPNTIQQADEAIRVIDSIVKDPALPDVVGKIQGRMDPEGFTGLAMSQDGINLVTKMGQLEGKAFLQAFETLKGGGQITEREGTAATRAIANLSRLQDDEAYAESLLYLRTLMENAKRRAQGATVPEYLPEENQSNGRTQNGLSDDDLKWLEGN